MSDSGGSVTTLFNLSLDIVCNNMNRNALQTILKSCCPSVIMEVISKIIHICIERKDVLSKKRFGCVDWSAYEHYRKLDFITRRVIEHGRFYISDLNDTVLEQFVNAQQTVFNDKFGISDYFDLDLFFKLVKITEYRVELFIFFQVCIQKHGLLFPKQLAKQWTENQMQGDDIKIRNINFGLKLGNFLADAGWFIESAIVLSRTYDMITTKWVCPNQKLKQIKIIQCLSKWLLVVSNYFNIQEAKFVLPLVLEIIGVFEKMSEKNLCLAYAYIAVAHYYYIFMNYDESWTWAIKAVNELQDNSSDTLRLIVMSHTIKISIALSRLTLANDLIEQVSIYNKGIEQNIYVDLLMNTAFFSFKSFYSYRGYTISNYYLALDLKRNLHGYYNLSTAIIFVNYAYARYISDRSQMNFMESLCSISQGIFIMKKIGLPDDNVLFVYALQLRALLLEREMSFSPGMNAITPVGLAGRQMILKFLEINMIDFEAVHLKSKNIYLKEFGEKNMFLARLYENIGEIYENNKKFKEAGQMMMKAIRIKNNISQIYNAELALSLIQMGYLFSDHFTNKIQFAESLFLLAQNIYVSLSSYPFNEFMKIFKGLEKVYYIKKDMAKYEHYKESVIRLEQEENIAYIVITNSRIEEEFLKDYICLDSLKSLLNNIS